MYFYFNKIILLFLFSIYVSCIPKYREEFGDDILKALNKETIENGEIEVKTGEDKLGDNKIRKWRKYVIKRKSNGGKNEEEKINKEELSLLDASPINVKSKGNLDDNEKNKIKNVLDWNKQRAPVICGDEGWHYFDGFCYKLINGKFTWEEALGECKKQNSNLVSIQSEQENDFVGSLSTKFDQNFDNFCHGFWIGMTRKYIEETDSFKSEWSDGTIVNYGNVPIRVAFHTPPWMGGQPDFAGGVEECVHSYPKLGCDNWQQIFFNQWNDARCSIKLSGAVCKKRQSIQKI